VTKHLSPAVAATTLTVSPSHTTTRRAKTPTTTPTTVATHLPAVLATPGVIRLAEHSSRPDLESFRTNLARAMEAKGMSASQLAKAIWGTITDSRGIEVARNRDRMTHYLAGASYPSPPTLTKMAQALDLDPTMLARDSHVGTTGDNPGPKPHSLGIGMTLVAPVGGEPLALVSLHKPLDLRTAMLVVNIATGALSLQDMHRELDLSYRPKPQPKD
jgi:transcriptional regulator with XRE-family HTH domain